MTEYDLLDTTEAAKELGVIPRRVQAMINQPCPECGRRGQLNSGIECSRCHSQGRYLPAKRLGTGKRAHWMIARSDLELVRDRPIGRRKRPSRTSDDQPS